MNSRLLNAAWLALLLGCTLCAQTRIAALVEMNATAELAQRLEGVAVIAESDPLPKQSRAGDLLIVEDDYHVKTLFEYGEDGAWHDQSCPEVAQLLNGGANTAFRHLVNAPPDAAAFDPYVRDAFTASAPANSEIGVKVIEAAADAQAMARQVNAALRESGIDPAAVVSIAPQPGDTAQQVRLLIFYRH